MFRRLSRRIVIISLSTISVCTFIFGLFSYQWAKRTEQSEFIAISTNYYHNSYESLIQHMKYLEETAKVILTNPIVSRELQQTKVSTEIQPILDNFSIGLDSQLLGISIYQTNGTVYSLSRMSNLPTLDQLQGDRLIRRFMDNSSQTSVWVFRNNNLPIYYFHDTPYSSKGTFTCLLKAFNDTGALSGIMAIDLDANKLFDLFSNNTALFHPSRLFLIHDSQDIVSLAAYSSKEEPDPKDLQKIKKDPEGSFVSASGERLILFHSILNTDTQVVMELPLNNSMSKLHSLGTSLLLITLISISIAVLLALLLKMSIVRPLSQLYKKIKKFV